jgi:hypothetical protein
MNWGDALLRGLASTFAPDMAAGALVELLREQKIDVKKISQWVQENHSLLDELKPEDRANLKKMAAGVGEVDWLTTEWAIEAIRGDFPAVASLFLGWPKARNWLGRQVEALKKEAGR